MNSRIVVCLSLLAILGLAPGCEKQEPNWCMYHAATDPSCPPPDAAGSAATGCSASMPCASPLVCDLDDSKTCVQCTLDQAQACAGTKPLCVGHTCQGCTAHSQCSSAACLPDGSCGDDARVAYVVQGATDTAMCTKSTPCGRISDALATNKPHIKLQGALVEAVTINGQDQQVTLLADAGTTLTRPSGIGNGPVLEASGSSHVVIYDLEITGPPTGPASPSTVGVSIVPLSTATVELRRARITHHVGSGVTALGGTLVVSQSTISDNLGGGISISSARFDITNTFVVKNGSGGSNFGGVKVDSIMGSGPHVFDFNTIVGNTGPGSANTGVTCSSVFTQLMFSNSIIYGNDVSNGGLQIGGAINCLVAYSDIGPAGTAGTGNISDDPKFSGPANGDFRLAADSPAKDAADPNATTLVDFYGNKRPQGARSDMGANEVVQ